MIRGILTFLVFWLLVAGSITSWRALSGKEKWSLVKTVAYGGLTAAIALIFVIVLVILF
jgi:hypothetical protein